MTQESRDATQRLLTSSDDPFSCMSWSMLFPSTHYDNFIVHRWRGSWNPLSCLVVPCRYIPVSVEWNGVVFIVLMGEHLTCTYVLLKLSPHKNWMTCKPVLDDALMTCFGRFSLRGSCYIKRSPVKRWSNVLQLRSHFQEGTTNP